MIERLIVVVLFDGVDLLDVTGPPEVFSLLQREINAPTGYEVLLAAETTEPVTTSAGVRLVPDAAFDELTSRRIDTLIVPGSVEIDELHRVRAITDPAVVARIGDLAHGLGESRRCAWAPTSSPRPAYSTGSARRPIGPRPPSSPPSTRE